ncbi:DNA-binding WRKY [Cynara cardunculus var. scolymus]|uniref:DNA-binding WRKY n=1 Tax=Cynara cardunculus var. scolymus TaxID=59895 RepID=A0A103WNQ3_CYNCS|nr:DNA-binding WRKY [Cynara cardunculus var. scolymus]
MKRLNAPKHWMLDKLGGPFAPKPSSGPHKSRECLPLILILRNRLKYALTYHEVIFILMQRHVLVDNKVRTDKPYLASLLGRFRLHSIRDEEVKVVLCYHMILSKTDSFVEMSFHIPNSNIQFVGDENRSYGSYYRCTGVKCNVRKHVERASDDPSVFITTYGAYKKGIRILCNLAGLRTSDFFLMSILKLLAIHTMAKFMKTPVRRGSSKTLRARKELAHLTNLEELDLSENYLIDTPSIQGCTRLSRLKNLKSISLQDNNFNKSMISCLSALLSLKTLDLSYGVSLGECTRLSRLKKLKSISLQHNNFNNSIISCLSALLSLKTLALSSGFLSGEILLLSENHFNGTLPMEAFTSFHHLEVLDLSRNNFVGSIPLTINASLPSIRAVSFAYNNLNGSLLGLCELKNLQELDLSHNVLEENLPHCFNSLSSLKLLDISSNQFTGTLPPSLIANLTSRVHSHLAHSPVIQS